MKTTVQKWARGLLGAAINSAASAITVVIVDPVKFNPLAGGAAELATVAAVAGLFGAALYLKQHPLPDVEEQEFV